MTTKKGILKKPTKAASQTVTAPQKSEEESRLELTAIALAKTCYLNDKDDVKSIISQSQPATAWINMQVNKRTVDQHATDACSLQIDKRAMSEGGDSDADGTTTCLCMASRYSSIAIVKILVRCGADAKVANSSGSTCLHRACRSRIDALDKVRA